MPDTAFSVADENVPRFAANYEYQKGHFRLIDSSTKSVYRRQPTFLSGGGGQVSTGSDYLKFLLMLGNKGVLGGERILGRKTVELMAMNHLPDNAALSRMGQKVFSEMPFDGIGYSLGFSVTLDPAKAQILGSPGEYSRAAQPVRPFGSIRLKISWSSSLRS